MVKYLLALTDELIIILCCTERARKFPRTVCNCFDSTQTPLKNPSDVSNNEIFSGGFAERENFLGLKNWRIIRVLWKTCFISY